LQFVTLIQALITAAKQLRCLQFTKGEENERMNVEEGPKGVRSPLLQRLIATASSMTMSEHAAQLLLALNTDAAASGDKLNLFLCEGGRFPQVYMPIHVADELLVYQHFKVCMSQVGNLDITSDTVAKVYLSRAYREQLGSILLLLETFADHGSLDHALSVLNLAQNQAKLFLEEFS
jgi:hypothetical protein